MSMEKGGISVQTEHIFPIIKKWLYSDKDIFLRELVSNACDACTKLKRLYSLGEVKDIDCSNFRIDVVLDKEAKTVSIKDNGIGMSTDEVKRYINQIALSGALEFIEKYDEKDGSGGIIGHFGLGFYSAFMVADRVQMYTKSYTDAPAVSWECTEGGSYEMGEDEISDERGTLIVLHITEDEKEYLDGAKLRSILEKYCSFMPVPVYFDDGEKCECKEGECSHEHGPVLINDTEPLWTKNSSDCTKEEYAELYRKLTGDFKEPLFHIHLNADYPLNFKGILYFPKYTSQYENIEGEVKLYYNQVFVADNIREILPDYMIMLKGVLDCPELPLNVSRSYLQNDAYSKKIAKHISKKVSDKLSSMFSSEREEYEKLWGDIKTFVLFASLRDEKFYERIKDSVLFKTKDGFLTLAEYKEKSKDIHENKVFYTTDPTSQAQYISMLEKQGATVVEFDSVLDTQFISLLESKDPGLKFSRVDSELSELMKSSDAVNIDEDALKAIFKELLGEDTEISVCPLKDGVPLVLTVSEDSRRMNDMLKMYQSFGHGEGFSTLAEKEELCINSSHPVIAALSKTEKEKALPVAKQLLNLAKLMRRPLSAEESEDLMSGLCDIMLKTLE